LKTHLPETQPPAGTDLLQVKALPFTAFPVTAQVPAANAEKVSVCTQTIGNCAVPPLAVPVPPE
jgi:hypothetical protein